MIAQVRGVPAPFFPAREKKCDDISIRVWGQKKTLRHTHRVSLSLSVYLSLSVCVSVSVCVCVSLSLSLSLSLRARLWRHSTRPKRAQN